jgi:two-component system, sensor histidine kinase and response regulator
MKPQPVILVVDDNEHNRYVHVRYLELAGFVVRQAASGAESLALAPEADLVILDVRLPDMSGFEVCRRLRLDPASAAIPILQTSAAFTAVGDRVSGLQHGADAYLCIPVEAEELVATVRALLRIRQAELTAQTLAAEMEARVIARTRELHERNTELEAFTYSISHDLRAPLRTMQNFASVLLDEDCENLSQTQRDYLERIMRAARRMDRLTVDLLKYSQLGRSEIAVGRVCLRTLVNDLVAEWRERAEATKARFDVVSPLPAVTASAPGLAQALANLLDNALKFTRPGVDPVIRISATQADDRVHLSIEDNGPGIDPLHFEKIFLPFERLHPSQNVPGTGIGLAIVRRSIDKMNGQIQVASGLGRGTTFTITLPACP